VDIFTLLSLISISFDVIKNIKTDHRVVSLELQRGLERHSTQLGRLVLKLIWCTVRACCRQVSSASQIKSFLHAKLKEHCRAFPLHWLLFEPTPDCLNPLLLTPAQK
jgi:hypothetical protein